MQPSYRADEPTKVIADHYEQVVEEETELLDRIRTYEVYLRTLMEQTYRSGERYHKLTVEDILTAVFMISINLRTELLHVQLEKALLSCQMRQPD
ncbi:hypothetical protein SAMN04487897_107191 [Paenibacillus sp. yr247]|uniref:hypothetical protein n=1 Tax=Paenibacillus sp. yr247 TaxID=1761880 RepID=UPI0008895418|nr:hypothetical protein [Paenibacillus sp. yr247]SDO04928.1 hypothetical protein SAMN04487897_107191 [Paenibacillus sp. yr247]